LIYLFGSFNVATPNGWQQGDPNAGNDWLSIILGAAIGGISAAAASNGSQPSWGTAGVDGTTNNQPGSQTDPNQLTSGSQANTQTVQLTTGILIVGAVLAAVLLLKD
jgi:hypothetical protein